MDQIQLDVKDRRILFELDKNSRAPLTDVAVRARLPAETVRYRVQNLLTRGVIQNFLTVIDGGKLGFYYYKIFFRFHNVSEPIVEQVIAYLAAKRSVTWIIRVDGSHDIGFTVNVNNPIQLSELIDEIRTRYSKYIHQWTYSVNIKMDFLTRDYLTNAPRKATPLGSYSAYTEPYKLDRTSWEILRRLSENARASASEIAEHVSIGADAVALRIKQLERDRVIVRYNLVLDNARLGQLNYYVLIYLSSVSPEKELAFVNYCKTKTAVTYLIKALGEWDYELSVETGSVAEYRTLMMDLTKKFSDIIRDYDAMMVSRIHKYVYP